jgi:hypothetical protein
MAVQTIDHLNDSALEAGTVIDLGPNHPLGSDETFQARINSLDLIQPHLSGTTPEGHAAMERVAQRETIGSAIGVPLTEAGLAELPDSTLHD